MCNTLFANFKLNVFTHQSTEDFLECQKFILPPKDLNFR